MTSNPADATSVLKPFMGLIRRIGGPAADELGEMFADRARVYRLKNQVRLFKRTKEILDGAQITPRSVPLRVLLPLLEGASLEDDTVLSEKWAGLLASAADPKTGDKVLPSFPRILECLSSSDAVMLDLMYTLKLKGGTFAAPDGAEIERGWILKNEILEDLRFTEDQFCLSFANLHGLGLVELGGRALGSAKIEFHDKREVGLTELGTSFVGACSPPLLSPSEGRPEPG